mgnify:FL=1
MISFNKFIEHKLMLEQDAPGGPPAGGPPAGGPPGGGGGPPPMPMPPSGGPPGGGGGPAPGGAGGQTAPKKLKAVNFWDVLEDELGSDSKEEKQGEEEPAEPKQPAPAPTPETQGVPAPAEMPQSGAGGLPPTGEPSAEAPPPTG